MKGNSRPVVSNQIGCHPQLLQVVSRHCATPWRRPLADHSVRAFQAVLSRIEQDGRPLLLDAGCGTADSSLQLAERHTNKLVLAVDQSASRLSRCKAGAENLLLIRADLQDFWRLLYQAGLRLQHHYLLYPNPWPKKQHLQRRWHGHPVFPWLLALGGVLEVRSNWWVYVEEFSRALAWLGIDSTCEPVDTPGLSPFERKYALSGQRLWVLRADLRATAIAVPGL